LISVSYVFIELVDLCKIIQIYFTEIVTYSENFHSDIFTIDINNLIFNYNKKKDQDLFTVDPHNGQIKTSRELVGYSGLYSFQLSLIDNYESGGGVGAEPSHSSSCLININVKEFNMHAPQFTYPNLNKTLIRIKNVTISNK
jgi:hypothetical protein